MRATTSLLARTAPRAALVAGLVAALVGSLAPCGVVPAAAQPMVVRREPSLERIDFAAAAERVREILAQLVAADTTNPPGNEARAVGVGKALLDKAGIPYEVYDFAPGRENLVGRLAGDGTKKPVLLLAHIDVVGTEGQSWTTDPRKLVEKDGYLYARGVSDDLGMAALALEVLLLLHEQKVPLARDVVVAWTGDEESGGAGIRWLLEHAPESLDAAVVINEGGNVRLDERGRPKYLALQTAEKTYQDYEITAHGPSGHSSTPVDDNAIYRLAAGLTRLAEHRFPPRLLPVTRAYLAARAELESPDVAAAMRKVAGAEGEIPADALAVLERDPALAATLRTTCVATLLSGGSRANALPAQAQATVNCRILPGETPDDVQRELVRVLADPALEVRPVGEFGHGEPSPLAGEGPEAIRAAIEQMWPGLPIVPFMSRGATDSRFLRARGTPAYGMNPIALGEEDERRAHGADERIPANQLEPALELLYRLVVELAAKKS